MARSALSRASAVGTPLLMPFKPELACHRYPITLLKFISPSLGSNTGVGFSPIVSTPVFEGRAIHDKFLDRYPDCDHAA
jgi:hypothetical protein